MSLENQIISFRRMIWDAGDSNVVLFKNVQSEHFEMKLGNLVTKWSFILSHCDESKCIMIMLRQHGKTGSDKILVKGNIRPLPGSYGNRCIEAWIPRLNMNLSQREVESKLLRTSPSNYKSKKPNIVLEIELTLTSNEAELCPKLAIGDFVRSAPKLAVDSIKDFTFICADDEEVKVEKEALSESSPVFQAMFESDMEERKQTRAHVTDIDSKTFRQLIDFLHTGSVEFNAEDASKNLQDLLYVAEKYQIANLKRECYHKLIDQIGNENVFDILQIADTYQVKSLETKCLIFITKHYATLSRSEHWMAFKNLDLNLMTKVTDALTNSCAVELKSLKC